MGVARITCALAAAGLMAGFLGVTKIRAGVLYDESVSGDLSNDQNAPTPLTLVNGTNSVLGTVGDNDSQDWLALTVPAGFQLTSIVDSVYNSLDDTAFTGITAGSSFPGSVFNPASYLGYTHFGPSMVNVGVNLLPAMGDNVNNAPGSAGFTPPLPAGTYTILIQQLGSSTQYQMDYTIAPVPIAALWSGGAGNWSDASKWSTNPAYPNNGASKLYAATINNGTVTLDTDVKVNSIAVAKPATLGLGSHWLAIETTDSTDKMSKTSQMQAALANGTIVSSTTAADPSHKITVIVDNAVLGLTTLAGMSVDSNSLLIGSTWQGDANLDRKVDVTDLGVLATNYGQSVANGVVQGDFNQDGKVDVTDLGILATDYGVGTSGQPFSIDVSSASVPEPASLVLLGIGGILLLTSRRRNTFEPLRGRFSCATRPYAKELPV
jgi:hypothetical protein